MATLELHGQESQDIQEHTLFIGGFNTTQSTYTHLFTCLRDAGQGVSSTFFYSPATPLPQVYEQLVETVAPF
jgi:hypothetical protein